MMKHCSLIVFADSDFQCAGNGTSQIQVSSLSMRWKSDLEIKNMIWHEDAYLCHHFVSSLEGDFAMLCMASVEFYKYISQRYSNFDLAACTVQNDKNL